MTASMIESHLGELRQVVLDVADGDQPRATAG